MATLKQYIAKMYTERETCDNYAHFVTFPLSMEEQHFYKCDGKCMHDHEFLLLYMLRHETSSLQLRCHYKPLSVHEHSIAKKVQAILA